MEGLFQKELALHATRRSMTTSAQSGSASSSRSYLRAALPRAPESR